MVVSLEYIQKSRAESLASTKSFYISMRIFLFDVLYTKFGTKRYLLIFIEE